jgi:hypothetical protein
VVQRQIKHQNKDIKDNVQLKGIDVEWRMHTKTKILGRMCARIKINRYNLVGDVWYPSQVHVNLSLPTKLPHNCSNCTSNMAFIIGIIAKNQMWTSFDGNGVLLWQDVCNPIIKSIASASPYNHHIIIHVKLAQYVWLLA